MTCSWLGVRPRLSGPSSAALPLHHFGPPWVWVCMLALWWWWCGDLSKMSRCEVSLVIFLPWWFSGFLVYFSCLLFSVWSPFPVFCLPLPRCSPSPSLVVSYMWVLSFTLCWCIIVSLRLVFLSWVSPSSLCPLILMSSFASQKVSFIL